MAGLVGDGERRTLVRADEHVAALHEVVMAGGALSGSVPAQAERQHAESPDEVATLVTSFTTEHVNA